MIETNELQHRVDLWNQGYWEIPENLDCSEFDFTWRPDPYDRPFIHQFGTQWQKTGGPRFVVPENNGQVKYQDSQRVKRLPTPDDRSWRPLVTNVTIDFSWHPDDNDPPYIYVFGNQWYDVDTMPSYQYRVKGATEKKYVYDVVATLAESMENWITPDNVILETFDYSWIPHPHEPPYIWQFGTQWQKNGGPAYVAPGATSKKYIDVQTCVVDNAKNRAWRPLFSDLTFRWDWHPDLDEPPFIYVFGNQYYGPEKMPTLLYRVKGATEKKYVNDPDLIATLPSRPENFKVLTTRKVEFDYSWVPDPNDPPYIYVFGNQHHSAIDMPTVMYSVKGATEVKYVEDIKATLLPDFNDWQVPVNIDHSNFDFSWYPNQFEEPAIFQFGTQWQKTGGPKLIYKNGTTVKYVDTMKVVSLPNENRNWRPLKSNIEFDYSWHPDESEPPYNYVFGNQWHDSKKMPTVIYRIKGATENKYMDINATLLSNKDNYESLIDIEFDFDYSWVPDPDDPPYNYVFGNQWHDSVTMPTLMYKVKGATETKYVDSIKATLHPNKTNWIIPANTDDSMFDYSWVPNPKDPPLIYQFGTQWQKTGGPQYIVKDGVDIKFVTFQKVKRLPSNDRAFRVLVNNIEFDYSWHPDDTEPPYTYVFGNQWHDSTVMPSVMYRIKGAIATKHVNNVHATILPDKTKWIIPNDIDDSMFDYSWVPNPHEPPMVYQFGTQHQRTGGPVYKVIDATNIKYVDSQRVTTLPNMRNWRVIEPIRPESFDFSWHPEQDDTEYNHVFGSKYHDPEDFPVLMYRGKTANTKYIHDKTVDIHIEKIPYVDSIFDALMDAKFESSYVHFTNTDSIVNYDILKQKKPSVHLLGNEAIIPRSSKIYMYDKITDYDHVVDHKIPVDCTPLDIIFISNGESCADENYEHLLRISKNFNNRVIRVDGINGREASQHYAANSSNTPWYFLVNAKLKVDENFDFNWQPNIYKSRRHYIFNALNPVNGLEYGHQAIVANNKILTLNTVVRGLDFTMDSRTEVVNMRSGVGMYNTSEWDTWRTAFRESIKLAYAKDVESKKRLDIWTTTGTGPYSEYSILGAKAGVQYYDSVGGKLTELMNSYDWNWIKEYYSKNI